MAHAQETQIELIVAQLANWQAIAEARHTCSYMALVTQVCDIGPGHPPSAGPCVRDPQDHTQFQ